VGQINGLTDYSAEPFEREFAAPFRLSVTVSPGRDERLVDIEREVDYDEDKAKASHVWGALTMMGYLASRYGQHHPISVSARVRFEQKHSKAGGDSASAATLFALLSALAQVHLSASLAITGAVGQYGEIQPIGAVNHKIEGYWEICQKRRLAGEMPTPPWGYGVLIPATNAEDLMLRHEVAASIADEGWFHVWPISTVDEGLALLTNIPVAVLHQRVDRQLQRFYELAMNGTTRRYL
jgi:predicted ATP-dependent protease